MAEKRKSIENGNSRSQNGRINEIPSEESDKSKPPYTTIAIITLFVALIAVFFSLEPDYFKSIKRNLSSQSFRDAGYVITTIYEFLFNSQTIILKFYRLIDEIEYYIYCKSKVSYRSNVDKLYFSETVSCKIVNILYKQIYQ